MVFYLENGNLKRWKLASGGAARPYLQINIRSKIRAILIRSKIHLISKPKFL